MGIAACGTTGISAPPQVSRPAYRADARMTPLVDPKIFKLKLFKEFRQGPAARKSCCLIGRKATAFDPHAHRFASRTIRQRHDGG